MAATTPSQPRIRYELRLPRPQDHLVEVTVTISAAGEVASEGLELAMAAWSPGSYLIRDYARYVRNLRVEGGSAVKTDKHTWRVRCAGDEVTVRYEVYGHDLTVRTNHIDRTHAFLHGPATYVFAPALADQPHGVCVTEAPAGWRTHCGLAVDDGEMIAANLDELLDCPVHVGEVEAYDFEAAGRPTRLVLWGERARGGVATPTGMIADLRAIMDTHAARFGGAPYEHYTFLLMLTPDGYGGLEHANSSANLNTPFAFATRKSYEALLELLSHEYFHVWNGKRIRPAALGPFDYGAEAYTRSLWVQEGITSYVDRYTLRRAGVQSVASYLERLADEWGKLQAIPGRRLHSVEEASFDAWIKLYKPDESNVNSTVSYYLKGGLVSLVLDHAIRLASDGERTIDDVLRRLWQRYGEAPRGYEDDAVQGEVEAAAGCALDELFERCIRGTEDPDLAGALARCGLELRAVRDPAPGEGEPAPAWLGVALAERRGVRAVSDGSPAALGGLAPGDELLALDDYEITGEAGLRARLAACRAGDELRVALFRRGRLRTETVRLTEAPPNRYAIATIEGVSDEQRVRFEQWLGEPYPDERLEAGATVSSWL